MECILTKQKGQTPAAHHTMSRRGFSVEQKGIVTENREQTRDMIFPMDFRKGLPLRVYGLKRMEKRRHGGIWIKKEMWQFLFDMMKPVIFKMGLQQSR